jgi:SAM-dependent methyltransferase
MTDFAFDAISRKIESVSRADVLRYEDSREVGWRNGQEQISKFEHLLAMIKRNVRFVPIGFRLLDVGCGTADLYCYLDKVYDYTGIDLVKESIRKAQKRYPELKKKLIVGNFLEQGFKQEFDLVVANGLFHWKGEIDENDYREYMQKAIKKMFELSKYGVVFNIITPAPSYFNPDQFYVRDFHSFFAFLYGLTRQVEISTSYPAWDVNIGLFKNRYVAL